MAELIWTEPALQDLDAIADYIALDNPIPARRLVQSVFEHVARLTAHPESGSHPPELRRSSRRYRQIVEPPCRVFYRYERASARVGQSVGTPLIIVTGGRLIKERHSLTGGAVVANPAETQINAPLKST
jgi:plasmid stabilization system protein ParE